MAETMAADPGGSIAAPPRPGYKRSMDEKKILRLGELLRARHWNLATAESCTGGLIGHLVTSVSGASDWYPGGVVAYANEIKERLLGVPGEVLATQGAVSRGTVRAMAAGVRAAFGAQVGVSVSGVAGPTGGTPDKPVGTVWIGWSWPGGERQELFSFSGDRGAVKAASAAAALSGVLSLLEEAAEAAAPAEGT
ncbi:CinA family protein [Desulfovibrio sp. X2]|uniref:CinA family protein n=1 Tax=Desulfovibrio sp. X2 TaxID=941449 RepID=UPI0004208231|nr:CinA family protein [Desulfovibrio sp. X2]